MSFLRVNNVIKNFGGRNILNGINFSIENSEIYGLVGLNGIGKTTMIKIILGLLNQDEGLVDFFDGDKEFKKQICYLPEKFHPSPFLKGHEFLELSLGYYGKKYSKLEAQKCAQELDLEPNALDERISKYSKGMGQKLGLLAIFLSGAKLLILDEPMSGLDPRARIALKKKLLEYRLSGNSVFFSSHILADIEEICDKISVINEGKIIFEGAVERFMSDYPEKNLETSFLKAIT